MLGHIDVGDRLQAAVAIELEQAHAAQLQPAVAAALLLLAAARIEEHVAFARPQTAVLRHHQIGVAHRFQRLRALLAPRRQGLAVHHHQQGQQRQRGRHRHAQAPPRQAQRAQRRQLGRGRQLAQTEQRTDHCRGREQVVGAPRDAQPGDRDRVVGGEGALADVADAVGERQHHVQPEQYAPGQQDAADHRPRDIAVVQPRPVLHRRLQGRATRPSRAYSHAPRASIGSSSHHSPAATGSRPAASHSVPRIIRNTPTR